MIEHTKSYSLDIHVKLIPITHCPAHINPFDRICYGVQVP